MSVAAYLSDPLSGLASGEDMQVKPYHASFALDALGQPSVGVATGPFGTGVAGGVYAIWGDQLSDQAIFSALSANGQVKDFGGALYYQNLKRRWNWLTGVEHTPYLTGGSYYSGGNPSCPGLCYIQVLQRNVPVQGRGGDHNESYLLALDPKTGKELWKHIRPSDAVAESLEAFSTPMPYTHPGRAELLITGGDCISGHNPDTGEELWRWGTWNPQKIGHWRLVPSPVAGAASTSCIGMLPAEDGATASCLPVILLPSIDSHVGPP